MAILNRYYNLGPLDEVRKANKFGFVCPTSQTPSPSPSCASSASSSPGGSSCCSSSSAFFDERDERRLYLEQVASEVLNTRSTKYWLNVSVTEENLKQMIREYGIPNDMRPHLWSKFVHCKLAAAGQEYDVRRLLRSSDQTIHSTDINENPTLRQIELDLYRTMPNHEMFESTVGVSCRHQ